MTFKEIIYVTVLVNLLTVGEVLGAITSTGNTTRNGTRGENITIIWKVKGLTPTVFNINVNNSNSENLIFAIFINPITRSGDLDAKGNKEIQKRSSAAYSYLGNIDGSETGEIVLHITNLVLNDEMIFILLNVATEIARTNVNVNYGPEKCGIRLESEYLAKEVSNEERNVDFQIGFCGKPRPTVTCSIGGKNFTARVSSVGSHYNYTYDVNITTNLANGERKNFTCIAAGYGDPVEETSTVVGSYIEQCGVQLKKAFAKATKNVEGESNVTLKIGFCGIPKPIVTCSITGKEFTAEVSSNNSAHNYTYDVNVTTNLAFCESQNITCTAVGYEDSVNESSKVIGELPQAVSINISSFTITKKNCPSVKWRKETETGKCDACYKLMFFFGNKSKAFTTNVVKNTLFNDCTNKITDSTFVAIIPFVGYICSSKNIRISFNRNGTNATDYYLFMQGHINISFTNDNGGVVSYPYRKDHIFSGCPNVDESKNGEDENNEDDTGKKNWLWLVIFILSAVGCSTGICAVVIVLWKKFKGTICSSRELNPDSCWAITAVCFFVVISSVVAAVYGWKFSEKKRGKDNILVVGVVISALGCFVGICAVSMVFLKRNCLLPALCFGCWGIVCSVLPFVCEDYMTSDSGNDENNEKKQQQANNIPSKNCDWMAGGFASDQVSTMNAPDKNEDDEESKTKDGKRNKYQEKLIPLKDSVDSTSGCSARHDDDICIPQEELLRIAKYMMIKLKIELPARQHYNNYADPDEIAEPPQGASASVPQNNSDLYGKVNKIKQPPIETIYSELGPGGGRVGPKPSLSESNYAVAKEIIPKNKTPPKPDRKRSNKNAVHADDKIEDEEAV